MREILFRGKRVDNGEWVYGWYCGKSCNGFFAPAKESAQIIENDALFWHEVVSETVGQYTDLTDKNGKKIFEGDIVFDCGRFVISCKNGAVGYEPLCPGEVHPDDRRWKSFYRNDEDWMIDSTDFEVIGNVHEDGE